MIQMKFDNTNSLYAKADVKANVPAKEVAELNKTSSVNTQAAVAKAEVQARSSVNVNMDEQNLISGLQAELKELPGVDLDRVSLIKQQLQNGEIDFNMGELAKTLANQI